MSRARNPIGAAGQAGGGGTGTGHFLSQDDYLVSYDPHWAVLADFDGDGRIDLAVEDQFNVVVSRNLGGGALAQPTVGPATGQGGVQFIDVDGDYSNPLSILFAEPL